MDDDSAIKGVNGVPSKDLLCLVEGSLLHRSMSSSVRFIDKYWGQSESPWRCVPGYGGPVSSRIARTCNNWVRRMTLLQSSPLA